MWLGSAATEWNAQVYHQASKPHVSWGAGVVAAADLKSDERVADLGCGTGKVTAQLFEQLPNGSVIAVDQSANMIEEARAYLEPIFPGQVTYLQRSLLELSPEDVTSPVDVAFSTATFHWIDDHERLFRNLYSILRPGGRLVAQCGGGPNLQRHVDRVQHITDSPRYRDWFEGWNGPWHFADARGTAARLKLAGFVDVETDLVEAPVVLNNPDEFSTFIANIVFREHLQRIPEEQARVDFIEELARWSSNDPIPFELDYWRLNVRGVRPTL